MQSRIPRSGGLERYLRTHRTEARNGAIYGILGIATMLGLAYALSTNRRAIRLKTIVWGLGLQFVFAVFRAASLRPAAGYSKSRATA